MDDKTRKKLEGLLDCKDEQKADAYETRSDANLNSDDTRPFLKQTLDYLKFKVNENQRN